MDATLAESMRPLVQRLALSLAGSLSRLALRLDRGPAPPPLEGSIEAAAARALADAPAMPTGLAPEDDSEPLAGARGEGREEAWPEGYERLYARGQLPAAMGSALLLVDGEEARFVPVFVGPGETLALKHRLAGEPFSRPLPYDLLDRLLAEVGGRIRLVRLEALRDKVFIATIVLELDGGRELELDARASDAVILALGAGAAILAADGLMAAAARPLAELDEEDPPGA